VMEGDELRQLMANATPKDPATTTSV
jgi:hypothetical protein